ncbi:MAG: hypothetical protein JWR24_4766 [Actinoallomurus sp.]|nr:hypothetical protein [Actinoallomurus sp.]
MTDQRSPFRRGFPNAVGPAPARAPDGPRSCAGVQWARGLVGG